MAVRPISHAVCGSLRKLSKRTMSKEIKILGAGFFPINRVRLKKADNDKNIYRRQLISVRRDDSTGTARRRPTCASVQFDTVILGTGR